MPNKGTKKTQSFKKGFCSVCGTDLIMLHIKPNIICNECKHRKVLAYRRQKKATQVYDFTY